MEEGHTCPRRRRECPEKNIRPMNHGSRIGMERHASTGKTSFPATPGPQEKGGHIMRIGTSEVQSTWASPQTQRTSQTSTPSQGFSRTSGDGVEISGPAELMNKLEQLKEKDPEHFQEIVLQMADEVAAQAAEISGFEAEMISKLADNLKTVAETGDLSALQPPQPPQAQDRGNAGGPPPGGAGGPPPVGGPGEAGVEKTEEEDEDDEVDTIEELLEEYLEKLAEATADTDAILEAENNEKEGSSTTSLRKPSSIVVQNGIYGPAGNDHGFSAPAPGVSDAMNSLLTTLNSKLSSILAA